jgi:phosphoribosyl 1,2-cyclic phosphodiesterase
LIDCGFGLRETEARLQRLGCEPSQLSAIVVTHEHGDHCKGLGAFARKYGTEVWCTRGTELAMNCGALPLVNHIEVQQPVEFGDLQFQPFTVPHDAREPCQFVVSDGNVRLGVLTDTGSLTSHIEQQLSGCDALILECNHDSDLLANGEYPPYLKERVGGRFGHLSNAQAAELLTRLDCSALQHLVAAHLSEKNNTPTHAVLALSEALDCEPDWITIADQDDGLDWRSL